MAKKDDKDNGKIYGTEGADVIDAKGGNDKVYGLGGDDTLIGGSGNDEIEGGEGAGDRLFGESGNDKLDDDDGVETASGGSGNDQINILFSNTLSAPQTVVTGDEGNDTIRLNFVGQDISTLRVAGDTVIGAEGQDDAQGGNDSIIFSGSWLGGDAAIVNLNGGNDRFTSTSEDSGIAVYGGAGNDTLIGGGGDDLLAGGTGTDFLVGNGGNDTLVYARDAVWGSGWSALNVSSGERVGVQGLSRSYDTFDGGDGYDLLVLRAGDDALFLDDPYSEGLQNTPRVSGIEIIYAGDGNDVVDLTSDRFSYGAVTLMGEGGDDVLWSSGGNDSLFGGDGNDSLDGGAGDDNLTGGLGNDTLRGGAGNDILYSDAGDDVLAGGAGSDTYVFEAGFGADTLHDTAEGADVNTLKFGTTISFLDATFAQNGEDLSIAIDGSNDVLTIEGWFAAGSNTFAEITFSDGTTVTPTDMADILANGGKIYVPPIEVFGTESNDRIFGTDANEIFYGFAGDDFLKGGNGNDSFVGGVGDDHLYGGAGSDTFYFNLGDQMTRVYDNAEAGQVNTVVFGAGIFRDDMEIIRNVNAIDILIKSTGDILRISSWDNTSPVDEFVFTEAGQSLTVDEINNGVQVLYGTEDADTRLLGSANDDEIHALGGNDTVYADAGSDIVYGGLGNDSIYGDRNAGGVELTNGGNDTLYGDAGNDRVYGGVGNDTLYGGTGADHLYGETGSDTFVFNIGDELNYIYDEQNASDVNTLHFGAGITAADLSFSRIGSALEIGLISTGDALRIFNWGGEPIHNFTFAEPDQTLTIADINAVLSVVNGTAGNDTLVGTSANETMYGLDGNDTLYGNLGSDSLYGGEGDDTLYGALNSAGAGGVESNFLDGGAGNDRLYGGDASDEILGGAGNDILNGNDGDDTLNGGYGNDIVNGNDGNDVLDGDAGMDYLQGGNGDDILVYDSLDVRIWGNNGDDTLRLDDTQQSLNLNHSAIRYIEGVDMTNGTDENTVTLTLNDVLRVSDTAIMQITGDEGDNVLVVDNLTRGGDVSVNGTDFASYTGNGATILIQLGLDLNEQQVIANT